jgi:hypothetical protein
MTQSDVVATSIDRTISQHADKLTAGWSFAHYYFDCLPEYDNMQVDVRKLNLTKGAELVANLNNILVDGGAFRITRVIVRVPQTKEEILFTI